MIRQAIDMLLGGALLSWFAACGSAAVPADAPVGAGARSSDAGIGAADAGAGRAVDAYIPADLDECFVELTKLLGPEQVAELKDRDEDELALYHHGLGTSLRNGWGLWGGSRLATWFRGIGVFHPDDMSQIIIVSFHRHLNGRPLDLDAQVKYYKDYWDKMKGQHSR